MNHNRLYQFRILTMLVLMVPLGILFLWIGIFLDARPIRWDEYSETDLTSSSDRVALVFFTADWDLTGNLVEAETINYWWIKHLIRSHRVVTMKVDLTDWPAPSARILKSVGGAVTPTIAIYPAGRTENPTILDGMITRDDLSEALNASLSY